MSAMCIRMIPNIYQVGKKYSFQHDGTVTPAATIQ